MGTRNVITVLGAVAGFAVAGPEGARWGLMLGSIAGNAVDPVQIEGARLEDLRATGYDYGTPIAQVYGTPRVPGIVAWASDKQEQAQTSGGKGGPETTAYTYKQDVLYLLSANEIAGVRRIWANGKLIWSAADDADAATLLASADTPAWDAIEIMGGAAGQLPWTVYEAAVGVGNAPAMRGRGCVGITGLALGSSGYPPQLTFEVVTQAAVPEPVGEEFEVLWQAQIDPAGIAIGNVAWVNQELVVPSETRLRYSLRGISNASDVAQFTREEDARDAGVALLSNTMVSPPSVLSGSWTAVEREITIVGGPNSFEEIRWRCTSTFVCSDPMICGTDTFAVTDYVYIRRAIPYDIVFTSDYGYSLDRSQMAFLSEELATRTYQVAWGSGDKSMVICNNGTEAPTLSGRYPGYEGSGGDPTDPIDWAAADYGNVAVINYVVNGDYLWTCPREFYDRLIRRHSIDGGGALETGDVLPGYPVSMATDGVTLWALMLGQIYPYNAMTLESAGSPFYGPFQDGHGYAPLFWISTDEDGNLCGYCARGSAAHPLDHKMFKYNGSAWELVSDLSSYIPALGSGFYSRILHPPVYAHGATYMVAFDVNVTDDITTVTAYGRPPPNSIFVGPAPLSDVVRDLCERSGLEAGYIDVVDLESQNVRALAITQISTARQVIEMLMGAYHFTAVESANLKFVARGKSPADSIAPYQLGAALSGNIDAATDPVPITRLGDVEIPAQFAVTYANFSNDYQQATEYSDRLVPSATGVAASQLPLALTPQEAKRIADINLLDAILRATSIGPLQATVYLIALEPADVITIADDDGNTYRVRIERITDTGLLRSIECVLDDATVLNSAALTDGSYTSSTVVRALSNTVLALGDWPIFRDADNDPGHYAAFAQGDSAGTWPGAALFRGVANTAYAEQLRTTAPTVIGVTTTVLGAWTGGAVFDELNSVTVSVSGNPANYTRDQILNGTAPLYMIGSEALYARTATAVSAGVYTLTGLLRGRRGTEWATGSHEADERVVLVTPGGVSRAAMESGQLGAAFSFKAPTFGRSVAGADEVVFTNTGAGLRPFSPVDLRLTRSAASDDLTIAWKRRTRLSCRFTGTAGINVPIGDSPEAYEIQVYSVTSAPALLRTLTSSTPSVLYSAADQAADDVLPGESLTLVVHQISAIVGRGYPHAVTVATPPSLLP